MTQKTRKVDVYIRKNKQWEEELAQLREIVLDCGLTEDVKWKVPCYMFEDNNIVLMHVFKKYCALLFIKGALLKDPAGILVQQTKNTQSARQIRFTNVDEIEEMAHILKAYIQEAIEVEKAGLEVEFKETSEFDMPEEFQAKLDEDRDFKAAFEALTPGRQRGYLLYFSGAKQSKTRTSRVERYREHILEGKGLNDN
ncbi:MAG: DUF1801 domain-containing protein [Anaerolineales bacterium]|nr:DUF1801 domain-containing protein [Anaerolineales bacterium]